MTLTPEERHRIYEEEAARLAAQEQIKSDKKRKTGLLKLLGVIGVLILIWLGSHSPSSLETTSSPVAPITPPNAAPMAQPQPEKSAQSPQPERPALELIAHHPQVEEYARYVVGTVKNNTGKHYSYVQIEVNLYDKQKNQVGSTFANVNNLEPYGTWKFKALVYEKTVVEYRIQGIKGW